MDLAQLARHFFMSAFFDCIEWISHGIQRTATELIAVCILALFEEVDQLTAGETMLVLLAIVLTYNPMKS